MKVMDKRTIEFCKYIGCEMVLFHAGKQIRKKVTPFNVSLIEDDQEWKLILRELKDIYAVDSKQIWIEAFKDECDYPAFYYYDNIKSVINGGSSLPAKIDKLHSSHILVDMLRSRGYAIGIDKEFYTTEKELKEK